MKPVIAFVNKRVIENNTPTVSISVAREVQRVYITEGGKQDKIKSYTNQRLVNKLRTHFDNTVLNEMSNSTKKLIAWEKGGMSQVV